ncbi:glutamyl-tRNA reductase [Peptococcaceae bacterium CEB3]|nr:glutamyl-tRNA reductase [Peptococcaceae bacterium CEB3]
MFPIAVGLNHRTAPLEVREKVSFHHSQLPAALTDLLAYPGMQGVLILNTCNRLEIYAATTDVETGKKSILEFLARHAGLDEGQLHQYLYVHTLYDAVRHLYRVTSGLDSMVLGETQILGQVAKAYEVAVGAEVTNKVINVFVQNALTVGKRVRTETLIDQHPVSISYTAVEMAKQKMGSLADIPILLLGAGEMSALTAKHLTAAGASQVIVSNRSHGRALGLAESSGGRALPFDRLDEGLTEADVVITATSALNFILMPERMEKIMRERGGRPLLLIDIAVPRDIHPDVGKISAITLYDIDDLREVVDQHRQARELAALAAEKIIDEEMAAFAKWHNSLFVIPTIVALQERGQQIKEALLARTLDRMGALTPKQEKAIRSLANSIVNQLLHTPITNLKECANTRQGHLYTEILQNLFDLDVDEETERPLRVLATGQTQPGRTESS